MAHAWRELWRSACGGQSPRYRVLVPDSVSDAVLDVWRARGYDVGTSGMPAGFRQMTGANRNLIRSNVRFRGLTGAAAGVTGAAGVMTLGISEMIDAVFTGGVVATGVAAAGTAVTAVVTGRKYLKDPKRLSKSARKSAAEARWITPESLGYRPGGGRDTDEQRLFHLAVVTASHIAATRAWTHPVLADHVSRVDLDHAVASIGVRLVELATLRAELEDLRRASSGAETARLDAYLKRLTPAFRSMADRVVSLRDYLEHLRELDGQLLALDRSERSRVLGEKVFDVLARTADDESADWRIRELNLEADSHADAIRALLAELDETAEEFDDLDSRIDRAAREHAHTGGRGAHGTFERTPAPEVRRTQPKAIAESRDGLGDLDGIIPGAFRAESKEPERRER